MLFNTILLASLLCIASPWCFSTILAQNGPVLQLSYSPDSITMLSVSSTAITFWHTLTYVSTYVNNTPAQSTMHSFLPNVYGWWWLCVGSYYLSGAVCLACLNGCEECSSGSVCASCQSGYYLTVPTCTICSVGCLFCTNTTCSACEESYYLSSGVCLQCMEGCVLCSSLACNACSTTYYLLNGDCLLCITNMTGCNQCSTLA